jgi:hypothetical protein
MQLCSYGPLEITVLEEISVPRSKGKVPIDFETSPHKETSLRLHLVHMMPSQKG